LGALGTLETFRRFFYIDGKPVIDVLINTTMFTLSMGIRDDYLEEPQFLKELNTPILQGIISTGYIEEWERSERGLNPIDLVIGMAMPEFDGAIIHFPIGGKKKVKEGRVGVPIVKYKPIRDRCEKIVDLALKYADLKLKDNRDKKIAIVFHNYPPRNDKIASAFGLDSPESVVNILKELRRRGFLVERLYSNGNELIEEMLNHVTNDIRFLTEEKIKRTVGRIDKKTYERWFTVYLRRLRRS